MTGPDSVVRLRRDLDVEEFDDALLVWDERGRRLHHLDLRAAVVWDALRDGRRLLEVAADLAADFPGHEMAVYRDVTRLAQRLVDDGLAEVDPT